MQTVMFFKIEEKTYTYLRHSSFRLYPVKQCENLYYRRNNYTFMHGFNFLQTLEMPKGKDILHILQGRCTRVCDTRINGKIGQRI